MHEWNILNRCKSSYKGHLKYRTMVDMVEYGKMNIEISEKSYGKIKKGSTFQQTWWRGSLGVIYWRNKNGE